MGIANAVPKLERAFGLGADSPTPQPPKPAPDFTDAIIRAISESNRTTTGRTRKSTFLGGV